jgi:quercetin dioxygenase-like cupin family protein
MSRLMHLAPAIVLACSCFAASSAYAADAAVTPLITKALPELPGHEVVVSSVLYPPGYAGPIHRHDAHGFIYVLEGSVVMQVRGGKEVTLAPGQTFYEAPSDVHVVGRNASSTQPAKLLSIFIKKEGAPILTVEKDSMRR